MPFGDPNNIQAPWLRTSEEQDRMNAAYKAAMDTMQMAPRLPVLAMSDPSDPFNARPQPGDVILRRVVNGYLVVAVPEQGGMPEVYVAGEGDEEVMKVAKQAFVTTRLRKG